MALQTRALRAIWVTALTVCCLTGLHVPDAQAEPANPDSIVRIGACATPGITWGVFVQGDCAYVADAGAVTAVDVSIPSTPWVIGTTSDAWANGIFVQDTLAYANPTGMWGRLFILCVSDPSSLTVAGWCRVAPAGGGTFPTGVCKRDTIVYFANGISGVQIIDVADPSAPDTILSYPTPGYALDLSVEDTLLYIADLDSLIIAGVADPGNPFRIGAAGMPRSCHSVSVAGNYAYVACQGFGNDGRLEVLDVSSPTSPQIVASVDNINGDPIDVWISGDYAYVAAADYLPYEGGLRVVDASDPLNPSLVASYDTPGDPRGVFAVGDLAFVADYDSLQILRHVVVGVEEKSGLRLQATGFQLEPNHPNPICETTVIRYQIRAPSHVVLNVYDLSGALIKTLVEKCQEAGDYEIRWDRSGEGGKVVSSGVYFYRLTSGTRSDTKQMIVLR